MVSGLSLQFRIEDEAFLVKILGCGPGTTSYTVLCVLLIISTLFFRFSLPGKWPVFCIGSNITSLCVMVRFATFPTGWIISFWLPFGSVTVSVVVIIVYVAVWVRGIRATVFVSRIFLSVFTLFSLFFQQATLISVMSWFFTVVARWFGSVGISVCGLLAHIVYR